jgi:hypothetical protein
MQIRTIRPGILVSCKTSVRGGTRSRKVDLEFTRDPETGTEVKRWNTTKIVFDPEEQKLAAQVTNKAAYLVRRICAESRHGLLCPKDKADDLEAAIREAEQMCDEFNAGAVHTRIEVNVVCGEVVADDVKATRALFRETEQFLEQMQEGLAQLDVKKVRELCKKALDVGQMLAPDANDTVAAAVNAARAQCRKIVKAGEQVAVELDESMLDTIGSARNSFLDFDMDSSIEVDDAPVVQGRAIDFWNEDADSEAAVV